jgi:hypothetical protein
MLLVAAGIRDRVLFDLEKILELVRSFENEHFLRSFYFGEVSDRYLEISSHLCT